jgi:hypothetical protein
MGFSFDFDITDLPVGLPEKGMAHRRHQDSQRFPG